MRITRVALLVAVVCLAALPLAASANGQSLNLYLSYLPDVSNWGPAEAAGQATVNVGEGTIELTAQGLPPLQTEVYEVWLATSDMSQWVSLGRFNAQADGSVSYAASVEAVPLLDYRYLAITVEPSDGDALDPSGQISIAAVFPNPDVAVTQSPAVGTAAAGDAHSGEAQATPPAPEYLPVTGASTGADNLSLAALAGGGAALLLALSRGRRKG